MGAAYPLRRLYNAARRRLRLLRARLRPYQRGLPPGIEPETVSAVCAEYFGSPAASFSYQHLSGWKSAGAYRLLARTRAGRQIPLIYKNAVYSPEHIPALVDLPVRPGPAEYHVYRQPCEALAPYLPQVYLAEELHPGSHYRYLLEDLAPHYNRIQGPSGLAQAVPLLPVLHQALRVWQSENGHSAGLLQYGADFSAALQTYAWHSLSSYHSASQSAVAGEVLARWPEITRLYQAEELTATQPLVVIHGDTNYTNIHLHRQDPQQFKVVDWEWAGFGSPYADLASLTKGTPPDVEERALQAFTACQQPQPALSEVYRIYQWYKLERGLLDASFLAAQHLHTAHETRVNLASAVEKSLARVQDAFQQLS